MVRPSDLEFVLCASHGFLCKVDTSQVIVSREQESVSCVAGKDSSIVAAFLTPECNLNLFLYREAAYIHWATYLCSDRVDVLVHYL